MLTVQLPNNYFTLYLTGLYKTWLTTDSLSPVYYFEPTPQISLRLLDLHNEACFIENEKEIQFSNGWVSSGKKRNILDVSGCTVRMVMHIQLPPRHAFHSCKVMRSISPDEMSSTPTNLACFTSGPPIPPFVLGRCNGRSLTKIQ